MASESSRVFSFHPFDLCKCSCCLGSQKDSAFVQGCGVCQLIGLLIGLQTTSFPSSCHARASQCVSCSSYQSLSESVCQRRSTQTLLQEEVVHLKQMQEKHSRISPTEPPYLVPVWLSCSRSVIALLQLPVHQAQTLSNDRCEQRFFSLPIAISHLLLELHTLQYESPGRESPTKQYAHHPQRTMSSHSPHELSFQGSVQGSNDNTPLSISGLTITMLIVIT